MKTLILGFDAFDPARFEQLSAAGVLPHLSRLAETGGYARLAVSNPPQTEVSWTSIVTGLNPGGHGIFDFVHRDPASYTPYVSLLPTRRSLVGTQFVPPFQSLRCSVVCVGIHCLSVSEVGENCRSHAENESKDYQE